MDVIKNLIERAQQNKQRIVLPEGTEERTLKAADKALADGMTTDTSKEDFSAGGAGYAVPFEEGKYEIPFVPLED